ncbi:transcriptional regulator, TetR family [Filimonas lacunae]|uniref:Transcriptional regulator, TetR family n=1 Tax=Filimonas lacunae TaxID=477680 RepID=A0A173MIT2_9BACT|nr:TetR/AcrR family transcriptional regulator [Filimonas lacunae]BAV07376.1 transcriptional regulator, TetR family [Filimonas lacunae]SIS90469.1 transcriptional regulator, TetR family [Filimonas lacunae]
MRSKDFDETEVLKKAITIFWKNGYNGTSLHDLIDGLGIARSSIYHAFGDKHGLYIKALELYQQEGTRRILAVLDNTTSVKEGIKALLDLVIGDVVARGRPKGCFKVNAEVEVASQDKPSHKLLCEDNRVIEDALYAYIQKGQHNGDINPSKDARALARFLCNTITGMRVYAKVTNDKQFFEDIAATALSLFDN